MRQSKKVQAAFLCAALAAAGCHTGAQFKLPPDTQLEINGKIAEKTEDGRMHTRPYFWNTTSGVHFDLRDKSGQIVRSGKLGTTFRPVSIFWPPFALIYWPMGLRHDVYDLTVPADGFAVRDENAPKKQ